MKWLIAMLLPLLAAQVKAESPPAPPSYAKKSPFSVADKAIQEKLRRLVQKSGVSDKRCQMGQVSNYQFPITSNICDGTRLQEFKKLVTVLAPSFDPVRLGLWIYRVGEKKENALLVTYVDLNLHEPDTPYLSLWSVTWPNGKMKIKFKVAKQGSFLFGQVVEISQFGTSKKNRVVILKHQNCVECEPSSYFTFIDFSAEPKAKSYDFTLADDHKQFGDGLECVTGQLDEDAPITIETRVLPASPNGPHVLQRVTHGISPEPPSEPEEPRPKPDLDEWWTFTCKGYRCDYRREAAEKPSAEFQKLWDKARGLVL
jgi:hypothetical protein